MDGPDAVRRAVGLPTALAGVPFGVIRPKDAATVYSQPRPEFRRLTRRGVLHRLAAGYFAVVPSPYREGPWQPTIEAAAYGIAAADYGPDAAVLMGLSAARMLGAIPRALAIAIVAVPKQRPPIHLADRHGLVLFVRRDPDKLDAERIPTELGPALVTGAEQTLLDLAHRPMLGGVPSEVPDALSALWPRADQTLLMELARTQRRLATLKRLRDHLPPDQRHHRGASRMDQSSRLSEAIREARGLLAELDDAPPAAMDLLFYQHGFWSLDLALRQLLTALGEDPDSTPASFDP